MIKKNNLVLGLVVFACIVGLMSQAKAQLASQYLRNGECYLLIGEGDHSLRGIYRLNNPESAGGAGNVFTPPHRIINASQIKDTLGFNVDLDRKIYTFTEKIDSNWTLDTAPLKRQVIDTVSADHADYGYHTWIHYDHRGWGKGTDVYRTGPKGRGIRKSGSGIWSAFRSAGPGIPSSEGELPNFSGSISLGKYPGKSWYSIPNGSWYSSWKTGGAVGAYSTFYVVFGDRVDAKYHNYHLYTWFPDDPTQDKPNYTGSTGNVVAQSKEEKIKRQIFAGCLDGCGGASGSGSAEAVKKLSDIAFQPPIKAQPSRTYFYTRSVGKTDWEVKKNNVNYVPGSGNPLIGAPANTDTYWLAISLKDSMSDYVYCMGTSVIKDWYWQATGNNNNSIDVTAVTVSNQWNQQGGVVYAYDKVNKKVYKFERKETEGTPITKERFLALDLSKMLTGAAADVTAELDDIKADGFGSLYFALSHPSKNINAYDPRKYFKPNDCIAVAFYSQDKKDEITTFGMLYRQEYGKKVYRRDYLDGSIENVGGKNYAVRYYNVTGRIKDAGWADLNNQIAAGDYPSSKFVGILASWSAEIAGLPFTSQWPKEYYLSGSAGFSGLPYYNFADPGRCRLAVINVPTPPKVKHLGGKKSYLDIIGPYAGIIPLPDKINRNTNQGDGLLSINLFELDTLYFYMVENYPLDDGAQDPVVQEDYDKDARQGGFITSIQDPAPYDAITHPAGIKYEWKTWMVEDPDGKPVCELSRVSSGSPYNYFYSSVPGKFIMACRVKYNWYDYDLLPFGSTIDDLQSVFRSNEWALPVLKGSIGHQSATNRLNEIMGMDGFKFMANSLDYSPIVTETYEGKDIGQFWALEPIIASGPPPPIPTYTANILIERCDYIRPEVKPLENYLYDDNYWTAIDTTLPVKDRYFGIESGATYSWRIAVASQTNLFKDISTINGTNPNATDYNYVAHMMLTPELVPGEPNPLYVNRKDNFKFLNRVGDLRWADDKIIVSAKLDYKVPSDNGFKVEPLNLAYGSSGTASGSLSQNSGEATYKVKDEAVLWENNRPVIFTTKNDLPPTDPMEATLYVTMKREYKYDMWVYYDGQPSFPVKNLPGFIGLTGTATVKIMDTGRPRIAWDETSPNNLFGITGQPLTLGMGVGGSVGVNPANIYFTVKDNNPWEGVESQKGLTSLVEHLTNVAWNYGYEYCKKYAKNAGTGEDGLSEKSSLYTTFEAIENSIKSYEGIRSQIASLSNLGLKSSHLNFKPVFSRAARDARLAFETTKRGGVAGVTLARADAITGDENRKFYRDLSNYAVHYRGGSGDEKHQEFLILDSQSYVNTTAFASYSATLRYRLPLSSIRLGQDFENDYRVPDGYANNTPGYRPYKFYVSLTDSSGNYTGERELNLALNVKDGIKPIGYGSVRHLKDNVLSYFPELMSNGGFQGIATTSLTYYSNSENYFTDTNQKKGLEPSVSAAFNWIPSDSQYGYINNITNPAPYYNYQSMMSLGDDIASISMDSNYMEQVKAKLPPLATEDNVESVFSVSATDNAGYAIATLTFMSYVPDGNGKWIKSSHGIVATFTVPEVAVIANPTSGITMSGQPIASGSKKMSTVFRGDRSFFPMAIPITITTEDDARDWGYYKGGTDNGGNWQWGNLVPGKCDKNTRNRRVFKTSLPVFGTDLNIRTLDKSTRND